MRFNIYRGCRSKPLLLQLRIGGGCLRGSLCSKESQVRKSAGHDGFLLSFAPDQWDSVKKFGQFRYQPLEGNRWFARGISATSDHLEKFRVLVEVANDLSHGFEIDRKELDENGYSPAKYSKQFSAVAECCIIELYSALDGIRDVVFAVYSSVRGVQKNQRVSFFLKQKIMNIQLNFQMS